MNTENIRKIWNPQKMLYLMFFNHRVLRSKDADGMAKGLGSDQTAPSEIHWLTKVDTKDFKIHIYQKIKKLANSKECC